MINEEVNKKQEYISPSAGWRWLLQRVTAVLLVFGLLFHTFLMHFTSARMFSFSDVLQRVQDYLSLGIFYVIFLGVTLFHALNGFYEVVDDYSPSRWFKKLLAWACWLAGLATFAWGVWLLVWWMKQIR